MASFLFNRDLAMRAVMLVMPSIKEAVSQGLLDRNGFCIVVCDRTSSSFASSEVYCFANNRPLWLKDYRTIAMSKAKISFRTGLSTREVLANPAWLQQGDTRYYGSAVDGPIIVACSGFKQSCDEMVSLWIVAAVNALAQEMFQTEVASTEATFVGVEA